MRTASKSGTLHCLRRPGLGLTCSQNALQRERAWRKLTDVLGSTGALKSLPLLQRRATLPGCATCTPLAAPGTLQHATLQLWLAGVAACSMLTRTAALGPEEQLSAQQQAATWTVSAMRMSMVVPGQQTPASLLQGGATLNACGTSTSTDVPGTGKVYSWLPCNQKQSALKWNMWLLTLPQ